MLRTTLARTVLTVAVAGLVAVPVTAAPTAAHPAASRAMASASPPMDAEVYENRIRGLINKQRLKRGLAKLRHESCTDTMAERWGRHLAESNAFYHQSLDDLIAACSATFAGETIAQGKNSPRRTVRLWMSSPGHRAILLSKAPRRIGIGAYASGGQWVVAADFTRF